MGKKSNKISTRWIKQTRDDFWAFLDETDFADPESVGERGPVFKYPEWLISRGNKSFFKKLKKISLLRSWGY